MDKIGIFWYYYVEVFGGVTWLLKYGWWFHLRRKWGERLNKDGSSKQLKSIKITINDSKQIGFFSQLDVNDAIEILERCLKDLQKEKASQNK